MLKLRQINLITFFLSSVILFFFLNSCKNVEPSWKYKISDPYHKNIEHYEYTYRSYPFDIQLSAKDSAFNTYVKIQINASCDSIKIFPGSAYIKSPHFSDTTHYPTQTKIESAKKDSAYVEEHNIIKKEGESAPYFLNQRDKLLVNLEFRSFAKHDKRNCKAPFTFEKSDFILYYDIFNNENPLKFTFKPAADNIEKQD